MNSKVGNTTGNWTVQTSGSLVIPGVETVIPKRFGIVTAQASTAWLRPRIRNADITLVSNK